VTLQPFRFPRLEEVSLDGNVLLFSLGLALLTGVVFGIAPALPAIRADAQTGLREGGRSGESRAGKRVRGALVALECALSVMLLAGALLLVRSFVKLRGVDPGFDSAHSLTAQMTMSGVRYQTAAQVAGFADRVVTESLRQPGVVAAAMTNYLPLAGGFNIPLGSIEGRPNPEGRFLGNLEWFGITPQFFDAMKTPVRGGRAFREHEANPVVIVNEAFARKYFPRESALGNRVVLMWRLLGKDAADVPREIVGVVSDIREGALQRPPSPSVFVPLSQVNDRVAAVVNRIKPTTLVLRTAGDPLAARQGIATAVARVDSMLPLFNIRSMEDVVSGSVRTQTFLMGLLVVFAVLASVLAAIGIYGVMSYAVSQMTREIGIRAALGATPWTVMRMILRHALTLAGIGALAGVAGALALSRLLEGFLFNVTARDIAAFAGAPVALVAVALFASYFPARRVLRIDPLQALRQE
jgi:predicted permease